MSDLYLGDCREIRSVLADNSVDTIITDPPYGLEFMGKGWDKGVPGVEFWKESLAVAKPGAMLLAFGGTRTFHRMTAAIEDAGWQIRDCLMWLYGSGFPKSLDISKAIDKAAGHLRGKAGRVLSDNGSMTGANYERSDKGDPITAAAAAWEGWGTALKPAWEPIIVAMKPCEGTFAENAEKWGVAGVNVDGGRIGTDDVLSIGAGHMGYHGADGSNPGEQSVKGRWPANLLLDEEAAGMLDGVTDGQIHSAGHARESDRHGDYKGLFAMQGAGGHRLGDSGGASRFFYVAKASRSERNKGCLGLPRRTRQQDGDPAKWDLSEGTVREKFTTQPQGNHHPTVKPLKLMEYLCTLTKTPTGGIVLDPFAGSGTTLLAAKNVGREYIGIEQNPEYFEIIKARLGV